MAKYRNQQNGALALGMKIKAKNGVEGGMAAEQWHRTKSGVKSTYRRIVMYGTHIKSVAKIASAAAAMARNLAVMKNEEKITRMAHRNVVRNRRRRKIWRRNGENNGKSAWQQARNGSE